MDVADLPQESHCYASVICQRKVLLSLWNSCRRPLVKHVLLASGVVERLKPDVSDKLVSVLLTNSDLPAALKACSWL